MKINRKIGPAGKTRDAWRKINRTRASSRWSSASRRRPRSRSTCSTRACGGSRRSAASLPGGQHHGRLAVRHDQHRRADPDALQGGRQRGRHPLLGDALDGLQQVDAQPGEQAQFDAVAGVVIAEGTPVTLNLPVLMTDSPALHANVSPTDPVKVLGLREGAIRLEDSQVHDMVVDDITGGEQLAVKIEGEYAFNVGVLGFKYDTAAVDQPDGREHRGGWQLGPGRDIDQEPGRRPDDRRRGVVQPLTGGPDG